ncbi:MAG: PAS domain-containing protein [Candidatus Binatia bacterium]
MKKVLVTPTQQESVFTLDELFFSTTDKKGLITAGNTVFARVSGYVLSELLGEPHNIVRHPDMPRAVFKIFWDFLEAGKPIAAYVKNMAKDGSYYWVVALAMPIEGGYLSIRFKPSSALFSVIQDVYMELRAIEQKVEKEGSDWKDGMRAALERLSEILATKGFRSYAAFMHAMLREEMKSRQAQLDVAKDDGKTMDGQKWENSLSFTSESVTAHLSNIYESCAVIGGHLNLLFSRLDDYVSLNAKLQDKSAFILRLTNSIRLFSLNASVEAARLGEVGRSLSVISSQLEQSSRQISEAVIQLNRRILSLVESLQTVIFDLVAAKLLIDMETVFTRELLESYQESSGAQNTRSQIRTLENSFIPTSRRALDLLLTIREELRHLTLESDHLRENIQFLRFVHLNGKVEAAGVLQDTGFPVILKEVAEQINSATVELGDLTISVTDIRDQLIELPAINEAIMRSTQRISSEIESL